MTELKFRAWNNGRMFYPDELRMQSDGTYKYITACDGEVELEQYSGLKDKNGKEIYEGDVVKLDGVWETSYSIIKFKAGGFGCELQNEFKTFVELRMFYDEGCEFEVIGNIHENAELLK